MSDAEHTDGTSAFARAAPRQGFEGEGDSGSGPVQPPGAAELAVSALELVGDLTKAGLSLGERVVKSVVARLPRP
ncbi:MAG TPA: hypothetical protein VEJ23_00765 [Solirubrobacteraceae bacterium]|nr:hypothetical protein [Solirubrobacteraceae bacterium]